MNPRLSVVLVVRDEADEIQECLRSLAWADEIVVLDTGSRDHTIELATPLATKVISQQTWQGFGLARQEAEGHATGDWVLMLDTDERLDDTLREEVRRAVAGDDRHRVYRCRVESWCFGSRVRFGGWSSFTVTRLYPRGVAGWDAALVHERLMIPSGVAVTTLRGRLIHHTFRTRAECETKLARYAVDWAAEPMRVQGPVSKAVPPWLRATWTFWRGYLLRLGFLDGRTGLQLAAASARYTRRKYELLGNPRGEAAVPDPPEPSGGRGP